MSFRSWTDHRQRPRSIGASGMLLISALIVLLVSVQDAAAQGPPVNTGSHIPVALWFIGAGVLGVILAWGILYTRKRTRAERQLTERATRENYRQEERDRIRSGAE